MLLLGLVKVTTWICWSCYVDLSKLFYVFLDLCQTRPSWSLTKISKLVEAAALNQRCWMSQSIQSLGPLCLVQFLYFSWGNTQWQTQTIPICNYFKAKVAGVTASLRGRKCPHFVSIYKRKNRKQSQIRENIFVPDVCPLVSASRQTSKWQPIMAAPPLSLEFVKSAKIIGFSCPTESLPQFILYSGKS